MLCRLICSLCRHCRLFRFLKSYLYLFGFNFFIWCECFFLMLIQRMIFQRFISLRLYPMYNTLLNYIRFQVLLTNQRVGLIPDLEKWFIEWPHLFALQDFRWHYWTRLERKIIIHLILALWVASPRSFIILHGLLFELIRTLWSILIGL